MANEYKYSITHEVIRRMRYCGHIKAMKGARFAVYILLVDNCNYANGSTWVSNKTLAEESGYSEKSVVEAIKWLEDNGYIHKQRRYSDSSINTLQDKDIFLSDVDEAKWKADKKNYKKPRKAKVAKSKPLDDVLDEILPVPEPEVTVPEPMPISNPDESNYAARAWGPTFRPKPAVPSGRKFPILPLISIRDTVEEIIGRCTPEQYEILVEYSEHAYGFRYLGGRLVACDSESSCNLRVSRKTA